MFAAGKLNIPLHDNISLAEAIYRDIDKNEYLNEIYEALLYNYSIDLFGLDRPQQQVQIKDALRFADLLSKSTWRLVLATSE